MAMGVLVAFALLSTVFVCVRAAPDVGVEEYEIESAPEDVQIVDGGRVVILDEAEDGSESAGSRLVIDYAKSMTGVYLDDTQSCYLIGGVPKSVPSPARFKQALAAYRDGEDLGEKLVYSVANDYPIKDRSLIPDPLQGACEGLPVFWMEQEKETGVAQIERRGVGRKIANWFLYIFKAIGRAFG